MRKSFKRPREPDELCRRAAVSVDFIELRSEDTLLAPTREAPGHPAPEDVLLGFDPLAWEIEPDVSKAPQAVNASLIPRDAKPRTQ